jgi:tetratricopeptide (TPR) repeat protein
MRKDIIGKILKKERIARRMRQQDVADLLEVSPMTVSNIERGFLSVADEKYKQYAKVLDKSEELFGIEAEMQKKERTLMAEICHSEDLVRGNPKMAAKLLEDLTDVDLFPATRTFANFVSGRIAFELKQRKKAKELLEKVLDELDQCPDLENSNLHSICLNDLGRLAFYEEDYLTALSRTEDGILAFNEEGERRWYKPNLYLNKIIYLEELGRDEEAREVLELLYANIESFANNLDVVIQIHEQFAKLLLKSGSPLKAEKYAKKGLNIAWENRQYRRLFSIWTLLGNIHVALGKLQDAKMRYRKALAYSEYVDDSPDRIGRTHLAFGKLLIEVGEKENAEEQLLLAVESFQEIEIKKAHHIEALITLGELNKSTELFNSVDEILTDRMHTNVISVDNIIKLCDFYESVGNKPKFEHYQNFLYRKLKEGVIK